MKEILENVILALNKVDTHGEASLNYLLASIQTLRNVQKALPDGDGLTVAEGKSENEDGNQ